MEQASDEGDNPTSANIGIVRSATNLQLVTLLAVMAAALLYGVFDLATLGSIVAVLSVAIWSGALILFIAVGSDADARRIRDEERGSLESSLHDPWLDD